jgi:peptide/nickel transport system substrate-binding protein
MSFGSARAHAKSFGALSALLMIVPLLLASCGGSSSATQHTLISIPSVGGALVENFSPYSPNANPGTIGIMYEPLEYVNTLNGKVTPVLATGTQYSADNKTLTITLRQGVKWSDGSAFTANDVVFTFNQLKAFPGADANGLWQSITSVTNSDDHTVVIALNAVNTTLLPLILQVNPLPQAKWSSVGDPTKYTNTSPVVDGPMKLKSFSAQQITLEKNPDYFNASNVQVDILEEQSVTSNNVALEKMSAGQADWTGIFDGALKTSFVNADPTHHIINNAPVVPAQIIPNLKDKELSKLAVRQAISAALDRQQMATSGESGLEIPASPTGLMPTQTNFAPGGSIPTFPAASASAADQILQTAGFTKGSDGIYKDKDGTKLSFKVTVPGDFSDYVADLQVAQQNLQAAGIGLTLNQTSDDDWRTARASHNFQLLMSGGFFGTTPWYYYNPLLNSTFQTGANATNWEQYSNPTVDHLLADYSSTSDASKQAQDIQQIATIFQNDLPVIPVLDAVQFADYSTKNWTGWPTADDPYAIASAYSLAQGDNGQILDHLKHT